MPVNALQLLQAFATLSDGQREVFPFQHPSLLDIETQHALAQQLMSLSPEEREQLAPSLERIQDLSQEFEAHPGRYPLGLGPLEQLWMREANGEIDSGYAATQARAPEFIAQLSPVYLKSLSIVNLDEAMGGEWRNAIKLQRLLVAAVNAMSQSPAIESAQQRIELDAVEIATIYLKQLPDGRVYRIALKAGEQAVQSAIAADDRKFAGEMLHRLGVLHLDPYTGGRTSLNYEGFTRLWLKRFHDELGQEMTSSNEEELLVPRPVEALHTAEQYFRRALAFREGHLKGLTLKALVQSLEWLEFFEQPIDQNEFMELSRQSLELLDADKAPQQRLAVLSIMKRKDQVIDPSEVESVFRTSLDEYIRRLGPRYAMELANRAGELLDDQIRGFEILLNARTLFDQYGDEDDRYGYWILMLNLIRKTFVPDLSLEKPQGGVKEAAQHLWARARNEKWDLRRLSAGLICLAGISGNWNEEASALELIDEAKRLAPIFTAGIPDTISYVRATLFHGLGANHFNDHSWVLAIDQYSRALESFLELKMGSRALDCLDRIGDASAHVQDEPLVAFALVKGLGPLAVRLENVLGDPATRALQQLSKHSIALLSPQGINIDLFLLLVQMVKGLRMATALYAGARFDALQDRRGARLLEEIKEAEALMMQGQAATPSDSAPLLDENLLLTSYARPNEQRSGDTAQERLTNLQHTFDERLNQQLLSNVSNHGQTLLAAGDVRAAIDAQTVIAYFYLGRSATGTVAVYVLLLTREDSWIGSTSHDFPDGLVEMSDGELQVVGSPFALLVESLRSNLMSQATGPRLVTHEAEQILSEYMEGYFGKLVVQLDQLRKAGKDHLCIIPHGPLHYYPFHLLGELGKPLAERWKTTYLPNLSLLATRRGQPAVQAHRDHVVTAIGLGFEHINPLALPELPQSISEARSVAAVFNTQPLLDEQATRAAVIEALQSSRYVHISTHGRHNVAAPAFQCLYLSPDDNSDGRLFAYELLSLDLRGLELLTLSACETALGRFDTADNLRGLPASFLLAGVSTLVGTLWPVAVDPAESFFTSLYQQLTLGASRLEAFTVAQQTTRAAFPKYRHWGAFYLIGEWS